MVRVMKKNPVDGGRYQDSVKAAKKGAKVVARKIENVFKLPRGSVKICLTKMTETQRDKLAAKAA